MSYVTESGVKVKSREGATSSIRYVFGVDAESNKMKMEKVSIREAKTTRPMGPQEAMEVLKTKKGRSKAVKLKTASMVVPLDDKGRVPESVADFVNEQDCGAFKARPKAEFWRPMEAAADEAKEPLLFEIKSEDGFSGIVYFVYILRLVAVSHNFLLDFHSYVPRRQRPVATGV